MEDGTFETYPNQNTDELLVKTKFPKVHEFAKLFDQSVATTTLSKGEAKLVAKSYELAGQIYDMAFVLFYDAFKDAPEDVFEDEEINPYQSENFNEALKKLAEKYALKISFSALIYPIAYAYAKKSYKGFIAKLLRYVGVEGDEEEEPTRSSVIDKLRV